MPSSLSEVLDARLLPCAGKHPLIFRRWARLGLGESFVLLNDHRPEPLRRQFEQLVPGCCEWREIAPPPGAFAVRLTRLRPDPAGFDPAQAGGCGPPAGTGDPGVLVRLQLDYRALPPALARERTRLLACGLADGTELQVDLVSPDPELDTVLTASGLTFRGAAPPPGESGWRYVIRHPAGPPALPRG